MTEVIYRRVPSLDADGRFPDRYAPVSVAVDAGAAASAASSASTSAGTATTQAGIATTQAGIATTGAGTATTQAGVATTQAGTATTQAGTATTQAGIATTKAGEAATSAANAAATLAGAVTKATYTAKGSILGASAAATPVNVAAGVNGAILQPDSAQASGLAWSTVLRLVGTGSPLGVVSAPVGSEYIDTAATLGARRWYKDTGAGNTGWVVSLGDTGLYDITALLPAGLQTSNPTLKLYVRRINSTVTYTIGETAAGTATGAVTMLNPGPTGFITPALPSFYAFGPVFNPATNVVSDSKSLKVNNAVLYLLGASAERHEGAVTFTTNLAWPTAAPI